MLKKFKTINFISISVLLGLLAACSGSQDKSPDDAKKETTAASDSIGLAESAADSLQTLYPVIKDGTEWPEDMPGDIPLLDSYGKIVRYRQTVLENTVTFETFFEGLTVGDLDRYESDLAASGFRTKKNFKGNEGILAAEKEKIMLNVRIGKEISQVTVILIH